MLKLCFSFCKISVCVCVKERKWKICECFSVRMHWEWLPFVKKKRKEKDLCISFFALLIYLFITSFSNFLRSGWHCEGGADSTFCPRNKHSLTNIIWNKITYCGWRIMGICSSHNFHYSWFFLGKDCWSSWSE